MRASRQSTRRVGTAARRNFALPRVLGENSLVGRRSAKLQPVNGIGPLVATAR